MSVIPFKPQQVGYAAKLFAASTVFGEFQAAGTLCGHIDLATPSVTYALSPDEAHALMIALQQARSDVLQNSRPFDDPRLIATRD